MGKTKKFYITTSIAYTNAPPHIGFALELIQADALARYHRLLGEDVFFLTGTDEHGQKIAETAKRNRKIPKEFCDEIVVKFKALKNILNLSNDDFIRTSDVKKHWPTVRKIWLKLKVRGDIYKKKYKGLYCVGCEAFITRKDLLGGKCPVHRKKPETVEEENYFFRLSRYQNRIEKAIKDDKVCIVPKNRKREMLNFLHQGLEDISFSRPRKKLKWGIPVPGDKNQTIYVWSDALLNYISALDYAKKRKRFKEFWPPDVQCIGKDIQKFHCLIWPAMLFSLDLGLPKIILVHGFITVAGQKMSKSLGNVIDPSALVEKYGTDAVRYFLLREIPPTGDGDFTYEKFVERYNSDLAQGLGNLASRVLAMVEKYCKGEVPRIQKDPDTHFLRVNGKIHNHNWEKTWRDIDKNILNFQFNKALASIWRFIGEADKYIDQQKPWDLSKIGKQEELEWVLYGLLDSLSQLAWQIYIFLPETAIKIATALQIEKLLVERPNYKDSWMSIKSGTKIKRPELLFPKLEKKIDTSRGG